MSYELFSLYLAAGRVDSLRAVLTAEKNQHMLNVLLVLQRRHRA